MKFEKMKKSSAGNHLAKLCTKFGVNPKMLSGSISGGFVWDRDRWMDGQTDRRTEWKQYTLRFANRGCIKMAAYQALINGTTAYTTSTERRPLCGSPSKDTSGMSRFRAKTTPVDCYLLHLPCCGDMRSCTWALVSRKVPFISAETMLRALPWLVPRAVRHTRCM